MRVKICRANGHTNFHTRYKYLNTSYTQREVYEEGGIDYLPALTKLNFDPETNTVDVETYEQLVSLAKEVGSLIIGDDGDITIYDDYVE